MTRGHDHSAMNRRSIWLVGWLACVVAIPNVAWGEQEGEAPAAPEIPEINEERLGMETAASMSVYMAVNEMQRFYEGIRTSNNLMIRWKLVELMRQRFEERIVPLDQYQKDIGLHQVTCSANTGATGFACFPRDVALGYVYFGLARAAQGLTAEAARYATCARRIYPSIDAETVFLHRPPMFRDDIDTDLIGVKLEAYPYELAVAKEKSLWPTDVRVVTFDLVPSPELLPGELKRDQMRLSASSIQDTAALFSGETMREVYSHQIVGLDELTIKPVAVRNPNARYFADVAADDLRRVLSRIYVYDWEKLGDERSGVCPDPRQIYLPDGRYVIYLKGSKDFYQYFDVAEGENNFLLEYFYTGDFEQGGVSPRIAWYQEAGLCDKRACEEEESKVTGATAD